MYLKVPTVLPSCVSFSSDVALAIPESTDGEIIPADQNVFRFHVAMRHSSSMCASSAELFDARSPRPAAG